MPLETPGPQLINLADFERAAEAALDTMAWHYFRSGSGDERTLRENRAAFERHRLLPRVLVDVERRSLATTVLGRPVGWPVLVAPMALHGLACSDCEAATARAAALMDTVLCVSTLSNLSLEQVRAAAPDARQWFQLYVQRDRGVTAELVARAAAAGYEALVVTVDAPLLGRREGAVRHGLQLPPPLTLGNFPAEVGAAMLAHRNAGDSSLAAHFAVTSDPTVTWRDLGWLRGLSPLPLVLKGVLRPDDARHAADEGAAAVVVSNHGGRQVDGAVASLDALVAVRAAVGPEPVVLVDSGVRGGADLFVALALGADACLLGRPHVYGLALAGADGVRQVIDNLVAELDLIMGLTGVARVADIGRDQLRRAREAL